MPVLGVKYDMQNLSPSQRPILNRRSSLAEVFHCSSYQSARPEYRFRICHWIHVPKTKTILELRIHFCGLLMSLMLLSRHFSEGKQTQSRQKQILD